MCNYDFCLYQAWAIEWFLESYIIRLSVDSNKMMQEGIHSDVHKQSTLTQGHKCLPDKTAPRWDTFLRGQWQAL